MNIGAWNGTLSSCCFLYKSGFLSASIGGVEVKKRKEGRRKRKREKENKKRISRRKKKKGHSSGC